MPVNYCPKCRENGRMKPSRIISYEKGVKCSVCDWKAEKPKYQGTPPIRIENYRKTLEEFRNTLLAENHPDAERLIEREPTGMLRFLLLKISALEDRVKDIEESQGES